MPSCIQPLEVLIEAWYLVDLSCFLYLFLLFNSWKLLFSLIQLEGNGNWPKDEIAIEKTKTACLLQIGERWVILGFFIHNNGYFLLKCLSNDTTMAVSRILGGWHVLLLRTMLMFLCLDMYFVLKLCMRTLWVCQKGKVRTLSLTYDYIYYGSACETFVALTD